MFQGPQRFRAQVQLVLIKVTRYSVRSPRQVSLWAAKRHLIDFFDCGAPPATELWRSGRFLSPPALLTRGISSLKLRSAAPHRCILHPASLRAYRKGEAPGPTRYQVRSTLDKGGEKYRHCCTQVPARKQLPCFLVLFLLLVVKVLFLAPACFLLFIYIAFLYCCFLFSVHREL